MLSAFSTSIFCNSVSKCTYGHSDMVVKHEALKVNKHVDVGVLEYQVEKLLTLNGIARYTFK